MIVLLLNSSDDECHLIEFDINKKQFVYRPDMLINCNVYEKELLITFNHVCDIYCYISNQDISHLFNNRKHKYIIKDDIDLITVNNNKSIEKGSNFRKLEICNCNKNISIISKEIRIVINPIEDIKIKNINGKKVFILNMERKKININNIDCQTLHLCTNFDLKTTKLKCQELKFDTVDFINGI